MTLKAILAGCFPFGHADRLRSRLEDGTYVFRCPDCQHEIKVLPNQSYPVKALTPGKAKKMIRIMEPTSATAVVTPFSGARKSATARRRDRA